MTAEPGPTAEEQVRAMLGRGWLWRDPLSSVLVHPDDYGLSATYDRAAGTLAYSAALVRAMRLIIPTPAGQHPCHWTDDKREHAAGKRLARGTPRP